MPMKEINLYDKCLKDMFSLKRFGIKLGLSTIKNILSGLGNPQDTFSSIHVAGTNGKGSIASSLASILQAAGYKAGLYTSPHLVHFNERICINNVPVSDENIVSSYEAVKSVHQGTREPTFFEFSTAMAFYEFGNHKVDWAVIETGMGGRLDATNIISPALSIISNLSVEHQAYLGNTIPLIAKEKGGIIKNSTPVVTGVRQKNAVSVLKEIAEKKSAPFYRFGSEFRVRKHKNEKFTYFGIDNVWRDMHTGLMGSHQIDNAALVLAACEILNKKDANLSLKNITEGLEKNRWPGRLDIVSRSPLILLDGAHNLIAARNLSKFLSANLADKKITLVIGILNDKPYSAILRSLLPVCDRVILTMPKIDRSIPPEKLSHAAKKNISNIEIIPNVGKAVQHAVETVSPDDAVCIAGSLYVVGEAKEKLAAMFHN